ncbi:Fic family protein [Bradyrhizobium elkanii USDA 76]|nr:Fic family protein [Bradyrhizobium elkanii USDA 76]
MPVSRAHSRPSAVCARCLSRTDAGRLRRPRARTRHYEASIAEKIDTDITAFLDWYNTEGKIDPLIKAAIARLWFVTIDPCEDGNNVSRAPLPTCRLRLRKEFRSASTACPFRYDVRERPTTTCWRPPTSDVTPWLEGSWATLNAPSGGRNHSRGRA